MTDKLNADARIKMAIGTQFVEIQLLQDRIAELEQHLAATSAQLAEAEAKLAGGEKDEPA